MSFIGKSTPKVKSDDFDIDLLYPGSKCSTPDIHSLEVIVCWRMLRSLGGAPGSGREEREGKEGFIGVLNCTPERPVCPIGREVYRPGR